MSVLLIRNPKTAGTSVVSMLQKHGAWATVRKFRMREFQERLGKEACIIIPAHVAQITCKVVGPSLWKNHYPVSMMRHPFSRVISSWAFAIRKGWIDKDAEPMRILDIDYRGKPNGQHVRHHIRLQSESLFLRDRLIPKFVIAYEHLQQHFDELCRKLGYPQTELPRYNASKHGPWRRYYEEFPELRPLVEARMSEDLRRLPYKFELDDPTGRLPGEAA